MDFLNYSMLYALPAILLLTLLFWSYGAYQRRRVLSEWLGDAQSPLILLAAGKRRFRQILLLMTLTLLMLAAARPWWGSSLIDMNVSGNDVLVVFDVSKSMLAEDVSPSRLEHAKWVLAELVKTHPGDRFGIIAFAGNAFFSCPLTSDRVSLEQCISELNTDLVPIGGTNLTIALTTALTALDAAGGNQKTIVLFTDGEELSGSVEKIIAELKKAKIELLVVGLGNPDVPALIPEVANDGNKGFKRDAAGELIKTRLNEKILRELAAATGGIYLNSTTVEPGLKALGARLGNLNNEQQRQISRTLPIDRFMIFLTLAALCLLAYCLIDEKPAAKRRREPSTALLLLLGALLSIGATDAPATTENIAQPAQKTETAVPPTPEPTALELYNQAREKQLAGDAAGARELYTAAIAARNAEAAARDYAFHNSGVIEHAAARAEIAQSQATLKNQQPDAALKLLTQAEQELARAEEHYVNAMAGAPDPNAPPPDTAIAQQILLNDRETLEKLKKAIEELKKQQEQAQKQAQKAQQENQQKQDQKDQQNQQGKQDQKDQQGQQDQKDQQGQQGQQGKQDQKDQQGKQDQKDQQNQQGQQGKQDQKDQQGKQDQKDQQGKQDQKDQQNQQGQQDQQNQQGKNELDKAREAVDQLKQQADALQQRQLSEQAAKAADELKQADEKQQQDDLKAAQKHLEAAQRELGAPPSKPQDQKDQKDQKDKSDKSDKSDQKNDRQSAGDKDDKPLPQPSPAEAQEQKNAEIDDKQTDALLDLMSQDEKLLRDAIKSNRNRRIKPVEKDW